MKNLDKDYIESEVLIHANIRSVEDTGRWYWNACPGCYNETEIINQELFCSKCNKRVPSPDKKFKISVLASDKTGEVQVILGDREVRTLVGKRVHQIIKENGDDIFPQIVKDIANQHYTLKIRLKEMNIVDHIQVYSTTNIFHGFQNQQDEETEDTAQASNKVTNILQFHKDFA
ncbi:hypothetical protein POM88_014445 [Heracleum sosnowskyi]|uniref:Replication factor A C-terminal domain-containing protein n=1 Tax=Heracleum sosnowskyi TaxID=360622 RepID=A0AAD8N3L2_9APIA|nr:hypothetical protein POM88_014445 [Heracleum sosnowskyi]